MQSKRSGRWLVGWAVAALTLAPALEAQSTGTVTGRVTTADLRPLGGVAVAVQGTGLGTHTDNSGEFTISNVPAGTRAISATLIGYAVATSPVQVAAGATARVSITLHASVVEIEGVTVSPIREGQQRALAQQKMADNIVTVISADAVGNFPDANVADALNRVSGIGLVRFRGEGVGVAIRGAPPEFSAVSINGVSLPSGSADRDVDLNALSTDIVGALEVNKALTPDMDADAIGGRVNIVTRGALDAGRRRIRIAPQLGYHQMGPVRDNINGSASVGDIFTIGGYSQLGVLVSGSHSVVGRQMDNLENTFSGNPDVGFRPSGFTVKAYDIERTRSTATARLDYTLGDNTHFFVSGTGSRLNNAELRHTASIHWPTSSNRATFLPGSDQFQGTNNSTSSRFNFHDRLTVTDTRSFSAGGRHTLGRLTWDYTGNISRQAAEEPPGRKYIAYRTPTSGPALQTIQYDYSDPRFPRFTRLDQATGQPVAGIQTPDLGLYNFFEYNERWQLTKDVTRGLNTNVSMPYRLAGLASSLKFGANYSFKEKERERRFVQSLQSRQAEAAPPGLGDLLNGRQMNNFSLYHLGPAFLLPAVETNASKIQNKEYITSSSAPNDYVVDESIRAAYAMTTVNVGQLRLLGGVRAEQTSVTGTGKVTTDGWQTLTQKTNERSFNHVFPSLHAKYELPTGSILRASFTTGINRPRFTNLRPSGNLVENETLNTFSGSNPDILPTTARAYDLMAEHYFPMGVISGGLFLKQLKNPVFRTTRIGTADDFFVGQSLEGYQITRDENGADGVVRGFELNLDRSLDFLPGLLGGLGVMTNYTYTYSMADTPNGEREALANQPSRVVNVSGYYEMYGASVRLSYNWQNRSTETIGANPWQNRYRSDRGILDLTSSYRVNRNASIFLDGSNLTNSIQMMYDGALSDGRIFEVERFGRQLWTGVRLNF
jgi:TonB-dependent receptor